MLASAIGATLGVPPVTDGCDCHWATASRCRPSRSDNTRCFTVCCAATSKLIAASKQYTEAIANAVQPSDVMSVAASTMPAIEVTRAGVFARVQVAAFTKQGLLPIPANLSVVIEVGVSDRDTLDQELLGHYDNYFLVSMEPVVDKYARGLARNRLGGGDEFQRLAHHHDRGIILPMAISDGPIGGKVLAFNVGQTSGCSSAMALNRGSNRLKWCRGLAERREVPSIPLSVLLGWIGRPVELIKIDAQGLDLRIIQSAGASIPSVRRFSMEVVSDDCSGLYVGQPNCSQVVGRAAELGFRPASPIFCTPHEARNRLDRSTSYGCEPEIVFFAAGVAMRPEFIRYHSLGQNGCASYHDSAASIPKGMLVMTRPHKFARAKAGGELSGLVPKVAEPYACIRPRPRPSSSRGGSSSHRTRPHAAES